MNLGDDSGRFLLGLARRAVERGLATGALPAPELAGSPAEVLVSGACFVTLTTADDGLRGCRGMLEPRRALAEDVWHNAWASAFDDPRFAPVMATEFDRLRVEISVLGPMEPLAAGSEQELHAALVPGRDGVVLAWRGRRATFLPQVWDDLPQPREFLAELKLKAGLPARFWAADMQVHRYRVQKLCEPAGADAGLVSSS